METTQMPINPWMDKQKVGYPYNEIQSGHEKEWGSDTFFQHWHNLEI